MVREERWYSAELKKELNRLNEVISNQSNIPEGEVPYLMQQIQVLEASKSMVAQNMLEAEKNLNAANRLNEHLKKEKEDIVKKLAELTRKVTEMTEELEERQTEKAVLGNELLRYREEINRLEQQILELTKQLDQRPSEDDVSVLRKELVHAQQVMDTITQEREIEIAKHLSSLKVMESDKERLERDNEKLESEVISLRRELETLMNEKETLESKLRRAHDRVAQIEQMLEAHNNDISTSRELNESNVRKLTDLQKKFDEMVLEKSRYEEDITRLEEEREKELHEHAEALEKISTLEKSVNSEKDSLVEEVARLNDALEKEKKVCAEKKMTVETLTVKMESLEEERSSLQKNLERQNVMLRELKDKEERQKTDIASMEEKTAALLKKLSEGEGCEKFAMKQMQEEKNELNCRIVKLNDSLKAVREEHEAALQKLEDSWNEKLLAEKKEHNDCREELGSKVEKLSHLELKVKESEEMIAKLRADVKVKVEELRTVIDKCSALEGMIQEKQSLFDEKDHMLESQSKKIAGLEWELEELRRQITGVENNLIQSKEKLESMANEKKRCEEMLVEKEKDIERLSQLQKEFEEKVAEKDQELNNAKEESEITEKDFRSQICGLEAEVMKVKAALTESQNANELEKKNFNEMLESMKAGADMSKKEIEAERCSLYRAIRDTESVSAMKDNKIKELEEQLSEAALSRELLEDDYHNKEEAFKKKEALLEDQLTALEEANNLALKNVKTLEEEVRKQNEEIESLRTQTESDAQKSMELKSRIDSLECDIKEKIGLIEELDSEQSKLKEQIETLESLVKELNIESSKKDDTIESLSTKLQTTKVQLERVDSCALRKEEALKVLNDKLQQSEEEVKKLLSKIKSSEEYLITMKKEFEDQIAKAEEERRRDSLNHDTAMESLRLEVNKGFEKSSQLSQDLLAKTDELNKVSSDLEKLRHDFTSQEKLYAEMEKKVQNWQEEKRALQERCLNSESDLDFERERAAENKRRFDDALSAMHELGRANQSLQIDISKQFSRKWLDDSEAVNCSACGKAFSLTIRKHHCRSCGLIFCGICSSKTASLVAYKNPVRVCQNCYEDITNR
ncbi:hypothetical protein AB6A40_001095 [Gnathostoma spinigerum]|uniref:FYVE-type domain-containing protein n=1 Tax=Gnathostoma spinigerum TaxID=75299 RepID=A0ABD6E5L6_9BILA